MIDNRRRGTPHLSREAWELVQRIRALPKERARFTLLAATEETPHSLIVVDNGFGRDSKYYVIRSPRGEVPEWAAPANSYVAPDEESFIQILTMFADQPELFSKGRGDTLDEAYTLSFDDEIDSWEAVGNDR